MLSEELSKLRELHDKGELSAQEYEAAKSRLLNQSGALASPEHPDNSELLGMSPSTYAMTMHLSQYAGYIVPFAGMVIPIAMWLYGRDHNAFVNEHGRNLTNFLISYFIYGLILGVLCFVLVGFLLLPIFLLFILILPIFAASAASKSRSYRYPLTINLF